MEVTISEELLKRIQGKVDAGIYGSPNEVVEHALDLIDQRDVAVAMIRDLVQEGIDDIEKRSLQDILIRKPRRVVGRHKATCAET